MAVTTLHHSFKTQVAPARMFRALILDSHNICPKLMFSSVKNIEFIQGDGEVGTIKQINFTEGPSVVIPTVPLLLIWTEVTRNPRFDDLVFSIVQQARWGTWGTGSTRWTRRSLCADTPWSRQSRSWKSSSPWSMRSGSSPTASGDASAGWPVSTRRRKAPRSRRRTSSTARTVPSGCTRLWKPTSWLTPTPTSSCVNDRKTDTSFLTVCCMVYELWFDTPPPPPSNLCNFVFDLFGSFLSLFSWYAHIREDWWSGRFWDVLESGDQISFSLNSSLMFLFPVYR